MNPGARFAKGVFGMMRLLGFVLTVALLASRFGPCGPLRRTPSPRRSGQVGCEILSLETLEADSGEVRPMWILRLYAAEAGVKRIWGRYCGRHGTHHESRREAFEHCDKFLDDVRSKSKQSSKK